MRQKLEKIQGLGLYLHRSPIYLSKIISNWFEIYSKTSENARGQIWTWNQVGSKSGNTKVDLLFHGIYEKEIKPVSDHEKGIKASRLSRQRSQLKEEEAKLGWLFLTGKMSEETYNQLRREWEEKLRPLELTFAELEREVSSHLDDRDAAPALMAKVADLYPRLDKKQQSVLLQILAKQIIVDPPGKIVEHELNPPFAYLRSLVQNLSTPCSREGSSEHVRSGVQISQKPPTADVERFLLLEL